MHASAGVIDTAGKKYLVINSPQGLPGNLDLVYTSFKVANRGLVEFVDAGVEHGFLVDELLANPLKRYPVRGDGTSDSEVMATLDLKPKAVPHVTGGVYEDTNKRIPMRGYPVRPVVFERGTVEDQ
jgi:hypothetical protein